jgi:hypothetical protein
MVDPSWSDWFEGMEIASEGTSDGAAATTLTGAVADQAALRGIMLKLWDLNLTVVSVARVDTGAIRGRKKNGKDGLSI